ELYNTTVSVWFTPSACRAASNCLADGTVKLYGLLLSESCSCKSMNWAPGMCSRSNDARSATTRAWQSASETILVALSNTTTSWRCRLSASHCAETRPRVGCVTLSLMMDSSVSCRRDGRLQPRQTSLFRDEEFVQLLVGRLLADQAQRA